MEIKSVGSRKHYKALVQALVVLHMLCMTSLSQAVSRVEDKSAQMLKVICDPATAIGPDPAYGRPACLTCPSYSAFHDSKQGFTITGSFEGHFTSPTADQALVILNGCEPHSVGFGGHALLEKQKNEWRRLSYHSGFRPHQCLRFTRDDGTTSLLCASGDMHFGLISMWYTDAHWDGGDLKENRLFAVYANDGSDPKNQMLYSIEPKSFELAPTNARIALLTFEADRLVQGDSKASDRKEFLVHILFDGKNLTVDPRDAETVKTLQRLSDWSRHT